MKKQSIGVIVGSARRDSFSKKVALYLGGLLKEQFDFNILDIAGLEMYNEDLDNTADIPQNWLRFRQEVKAADAVLFITPEYNRSMPPVLKNALDIASRPREENAWGGKPGAVVSISPGKTGGFGANHHLRQSASCLNILLLQKPEAYISEIANAMDAGGVPDKETKEFLQRFANAFSKWIKKLTA